MSVAVLIMAGGRGSRFSSALPKQYVPIGQKPLLRYTLEACLTHPAVTMVQVVIHPDDEALYLGITQDLPLLPPVYGGMERQQSVYNGLEALHAHAPHYVLIHDAARPLLPQQVITRVLDVLQAGTQAVLPVMPVVDTIKEREGNKSIGTVDRSRLCCAQTPQGFHYATILDLHRRYKDENYTDDTALCEKAGIAVHLVEGAASLLKVTTPADKKMIENFLHIKEETRVGMGFDVHRFIVPSPFPEEGCAIMLCGIKVPHTALLEAHSDGDVGLHALVDALLGTIGAGDIGMHFPPSDPQWRHADSSQFVLHAMQLIQQKGGRVANVDITIIGEAPKVGPHRERMQQRIATLLESDVSQVNVKATTTEKMGFTGRKEGIAAQAIATVILPAT